MGTEKRFLRVDELSGEEKGRLSKTLEKDHRYIDDDLFRAFNDEKGMFYNFKRIVEENLGELIVAFRGNSNKITIYYNNHVVWDLSISNKSVYTVSFNYDHARYYCGENGKDTGEDCLTPLKKLLNRDDKEWFGRKTKNVSSQGFSKQAEIGILEWKKKKGDPFEYIEIEESYKIIKDILDSYFNIRCSVDRFREKNNIVVKERGKQSYIEKRWQQRLFNHFKSTTGFVKTDLFAYDLEFSQPFPDRTIRGKIGVNEPDILAVRFEKGVPKKLVFVEVKSTKSACISKTSGISEHIIRMRRYTDESCFLKKRVEDAWRILEQYQQTGLYKQLEGIDFDALKKTIKLEDNVERVLLLTNNILPPEEMTEEERKKGSSLEYYKASKKEIKELAKVKECKIWTTENNYFKECELKIDEESLDNF